MRLIKEIPHTRYLIQVHEYNSKYLLKITLDSYEQIFKFDIDSGLQLDDLDDLDDLLSEDFLANCLTRFISMRADSLKLIMIKK
jgi:hypothetical protein